MDPSAGLNVMANLSNTTLTSAISINDTLPNSTDWVGWLLFFQRMNRIVCCTLGLPLNLIMAIFILRSSQPWSSPNIIYLCLSLIHLIMISQTIEELIFDAPVTPIVTSDWKVYSREILSRSKFCFSFFKITLQLTIDYKENGTNWINLFLSIYI